MMKKKTTVKKPPVKKAPAKKPPVKKAPAKKPDVKSPAETRKSISRKQTGTSRPARGVESGSLRDKALKEAQANARSATTSKTTKAGLLRSFGARAFGAIGAIVDPTFLSGKGEGKLNNDPVTRSLEASSTMSSMYKKMKREIRQGSELAVTGVREGVIGRTRSLRNKTGQNRPEYPTWKNKPKASESSSSAQIGLNKPPRWREDAAWEYNAPIGPKKPKSSGNTSGVGGPGGARALTDVKAKKSSPSNTAATTAAASSGGTSKASGAAQNRPTTTRPKPMNTLAADYAAMQQGQAKAKSAAPKPKPRPSQAASSAPVKRGGLLSRTEREGLSTDRMQRKPKGNLLGFLKKRK